MALTREDLINNFFREIIDLEHKAGKDRDRAYVLDLLAEIACALNGERPGKPTQIDPAALESLAESRPRTR